MSNPSSGWTVVDPEAPLLTYAYTFGQGHAHALAVGGADGLLVVSPPCNVPEAAFTELERYGKVRVLVAPNAYHTLGIGPWSRRFPEAAVFAPAQSIARVEKQSKVRGIRPLADASSLTGPKVELVDMPHYKTGEALVRVETASGLVWYVTDVIFNMQQLPPGFPFNLVFKWTGSAPGFRLNAIAPLFMVKDKRALYRWMRGEVEKAPPRLVLTSHGAPMKLDPPGKQLLDILPAG